MAPQADLGGTGGMGGPRTDSGARSTHPLHPAVHTTDLFLKFILCIWLCWVLAVTCKLLAAACGISFPDQGWNLGPLCWEHGVLAWTTREASSPPHPAQRDLTTVKNLVCLVTS